MSKVSILLFVRPFLIRASFTFCKGELEGKKEGSCKLYPAAAAVFANERLLLPALRPLLSLPPRRPSAILPLKPEFYSRNAALARFV